MNKENLEKPTAKKRRANGAPDAAQAERAPKKRNPFAKIAVPVAAAAVILTAGVVASSVSLGLFSGETHEAFIATPQSAAELAAPQGIFLEGISVAGVDLGGQTMKAARELLTVQESEMIPSINYTLSCNDKIVYITEDDFDFSFDTVQRLNEAYEYSEYMRAILNSESRTTLKGSEKRDYPILMTFDESSVKKACQAVAEKVNVPMQDAHVTNIDVTKENVADMFSFADGVTGSTLDVDDLVNQINTLRKNKQYTADIIGEMLNVEPTISLEDLKKNLVLISQYVTYSGNTWAGNMNMMTAMESMNGTIIKPGEVFSFNGHTGNSNLAENGYYAAGVIVNGRSADGIGGGICQAATTIYNAAVRADMTVVEREPHTWPSVYVPIGIDSAIDYGNIDMKFRNDTEHEVYLICYMEGAALNAFIYGYKPTDYDEICISSWFTGYSGNGFGAVAERNYYKGGKIVKTEDLPSSYYSNGGGTSYSSEEMPSGYVFKRVFTDRQAADGSTGPAVTADTDTDGSDTDAEESGETASAAEETNENVEAQTEGGEAATEGGAEETAAEETTAQETAAEENTGENIDENIDETIE